MFVVRTGMDPGSIKGAQIEVARASSAKDKAARALILHTVKETKAMDILRRNVALSLSSFSDGRFVQLAVVSSDLLDQIPCPIRLGSRVATDTASIYLVGLL